MSSSVKSSIVFVVVAAVLGCAVWLGWSLINHRLSLPIGDSQTNNVKVSVGVTGSPKSLDIRTVDDESLDRVLLGNVYETLLKRDDHNKLQPGLASSWKVSDDGMTYQLTIRGNASFANGDGLDAADAVWSLQQIITKKYVDSSELAALSAVSNQGDTLILKLAKPDARLLEKLSTRLGIVYDQDAGIDYATQASASGPFTVSSWQAGKPLTLQRNTNYWGDQSKAAQVSVVFKNTTAELADALNKGQIDAAVALDKAGSDAVTAKDVTKEQGVSNRKIVLAFSNNTQSILSDKRYRQAMRYLIDKDQMTAALGGGTVLTGPLSPLDDGYQKDVNGTDAFPHDIAKGNELVAYFRFSVTRRPLTFTYLKDYGSKVGEQLTGTVYPEPVKADLTVNMVDQAGWQQNVADKRNYDFTLYETDGEDDFETIMNNQSYIAFVSTESQNAWTKVQQSATADEYASNFQAFVKTLNDDSPVDWICTRNPITVHRNGVTGVPVNMTYTQLPLENMTTVE